MRARLSRARDRIRTAGDYSVPQCGCKEKREERREKSEGASERRERRSMDPTAMDERELAEMRCDRSIVHCK